MNSVLVILAEYFPESTSTTTCLSPFLRYLLSKGVRVDVLTARRSEELPLQESVDGVNIWRVDHRWELNSAVWERRLSGCSGVKRAATKAAMIASKATYRIGSHLFSYTEPRMFGWSRRRVTQLAKELCEQNSYDAVFSISLPFVVHEIAREIKKATGVTWIQIEYDPFYKNAMLRGVLRDALCRRKQTRCYEACDGVITTHELYNYYNCPDNEMYAYVQKMTPVSYANMKPLPETEPDEEVEQLRREHTVLFYGGALYKGIREPDLALSVLSRVSSDYRFLMYTTMEASGEYEQLYAAMGERVTRKPPVPWVQIVSVMRTADILVSIGNTVPFQVPGKTFEYMATGKPIIHFSPCEEDTALPYLASYPLALVIRNGDDIEESAAKAERFISDHAGKCISYEQVMSCMPQLNSRQVCEEFWRLTEEMIG